MRTTVIYTTGAPGSAKSYYRCARFMTDDFLVNTEARHISNFPINVEAMANLVAKKHKRDAAAIADRIATFPAEEVEKWTNTHIHGGGNKDHHIYGPWDLLNDIDISGAHIAIDEIHNFCGRNASKSIQARWEAWLGEIRHQGATIEFLTQHPNKCAPCIPNHAEIRHQLIKGETRPDFWFKIPMYDWYQLKAKLLGKFKSCFWQITERQELGKWRIVDQLKFQLDSEYFGVYDSHSKPIAGGQAGTERPMEWATMTWPRLLLWFIARNDWKLITRGALLALVPGLVLGGPYIAPLAFSTLPKYISSQMATKPIGEKKPAKAETPEAKNAESVPVAPGAAVKVSPAAAAALGGELVPDDSDAWLLVLLSREHVVFANGREYAIGEIIDEGPYLGAAVHVLDFERRRMLLTDGRMVRMATPAPGGMPKPDADPSASGGNLAGRLSRGALTSRKAAPRAAAQPAANDQR